MSGGAEGEFYTYWFEKNLQGDVVAVYNETGTKLISYAYDAWGNFRTTTHNRSGTNAYAAYIPFRYRGYYYDDFYGCLDDGYGRKIGFYYLNSRYYNPEWGRFINADGYVSTGTGLLGYNMFAYCNNNPVMYVDPDGEFPFLSKALGVVFQVVTSVVSYAGMAVVSIFDEDVREDMNSIHWNPFNSDETATVNSKKVSFYKGVPVYKVDNLAGENYDSSASFGIILLDKDHGVEVLKHERGHNTQLMTMGILNYAIGVALPSPLFNEDTTPWELSASMLGGSNLGASASKRQKTNAWIYYISLCIF